MKKLVLVTSAALALVLTTGFTCSKNAPQQAAPTADQANMAAPAPASTDGTAAAASADGTAAPATVSGTETK